MSAYDQPVHTPLLLLLASLIILPVYSHAAPEGMRLSPSPQKKVSRTFNTSERVIDYAVSADGGQILSLVNDGEPGTWLSLSRTATLDEKPAVGKKERIDGSALAVVAHPETNGIWFLLVRSGEKGPWSILRIEEKDGKFAKPVALHTSRDPLRRLVISSRPFIKWESEDKKLDVGYRLLFSEKSKGLWQMKSVSVYGQRLVDLSHLNVPKSVLICPPGVSPEGNGYSCEEIPSIIHAPKGALPLSFHPSGSKLYMEDEAGCIRVAGFSGQWYSSDYTQRKKGELKKSSCEKNQFFHPNGALSWSWKKGVPGIEVRSVVPETDKETRRWFADSTFSMPPVVLPDGRGLVALQKPGDRETLSVLPIEDFRSGISNLWRFSELKDVHLKGMEKQGGVLSKVPPYSYFHEIYDAHAYRDILRPVLVTTDPFWYTVGTAMEAGFVLMEQHHAIPRYQEFLDAAIRELTTRETPSAQDKSWLEIFRVSRKLLDPKSIQEEVHEDYSLCTKADGSQQSSLLKKGFDFSECKPRSHYDDGGIMAQYWRSFRYFTLGTSWSANSPGPLAESVLSTFPEFSSATMKSATSWFDGYTEWMAPTTFPALREKNAKKRWKSSHPFRSCGLESGAVAATHALFPLGWGWDDELTCRIMNDRKNNARLEEWLSAFSGDPSYEKWVPATDAKYPWKEWQSATLTHFKSRTSDTTLYSLYLAGIRQDLLLHEPQGIFAPISQAFMQARAAASAVGGWTHLKHTLQLVTEEPSGAEGGQGGPSPFEILVTDDPPGAVEPRPEVFQAQKRVMEEVIRLATKSLGPSHGYLTPAKEVAARLGLFAKAAEAQKKSQPLDPQTLEEIEKFGGFLDHMDLTFHAMTNPKYAVTRSLSSMAILASVGNYTREMKRTAYVATGKPFETFVIVEQDGKRRIVVGGTFSVYSFEDPRMISDEEWRSKELPKATLPEWLKPFVVEIK